MRDLERLFADSAVKVTSLDMIMGKRSGILREVDITLRSRVSSVPIMIAIECRDRTSKSDVTWIEQLNAKCKDIGANKIIAVSRSGFSKSAATLALQYGIEARTLRDLTPVETFDWLELREFTSFFVSCRLIEISVFVSSSSSSGVKVELPGGKFSADFPIFFRKTDKTAASINDP